MNLTNRFDDFSRFTFVCVARSHFIHKSPPQKIKKKSMESQHQSRVLKYLTDLFRDKNHKFVTRFLDTNKLKNN